MARSQSMGRGVRIARRTQTLRVEPTGTPTIAAVLGIRYRKLDNGEFHHSTAIVLLDGQGHVKVRSEGIGKDPAPLLRALE